MRFCSVGLPTVPRACGFVCKIAIVVGPLLSCPKHFGSDKIPKCPFISSIEKPLNAQQLIAEYHSKNYEAIDQPLPLQTPMYYQELPYYNP